MALNFPNSSRSYEETHHRVRFAGYDGLNQIVFFLLSDGLSFFDSRVSRSEQGALAVFDKNINRILDAATKAYRGKRQNTYLLGAEAF